MDGQEEKLARSLQSSVYLSTLEESLADLGNADDDVYARLLAALDEIAKLKEENFQESRKRQEAEKEMYLVRQKAKQETELLKHDTGRLKQQIEQLQSQLNETLDRLTKADDQQLALEQFIADSDRVNNDLECDLGALRCVLSSLQADCDRMEIERDSAIREAEVLRKNGEHVSSEFSLSDLELATQNFSDSCKIGEGGFGAVFKGFLHNTTVAIKKLRTESPLGLSQFQQEVAVLSRVRHPNLVALLGSCLESSALVYEFLPNGTLEDHLNRTSDSPPLTWQARTRIIGEICSALIFLHKNKPCTVIHGDLKPANILLDANLVCKLGDFGISHLLTQTDTATTALYWTEHLSGTPAYMDPEFMSTGELTPQSDVYSFGIVILRLLTRKGPLGIVRAVQEALQNDNLQSMIDTSAGDWPFVQAQQLAYLALRCTDQKRRNRPDLVTEVWTVVGPLMKSASLSAAPPPSGSVFDDSRTPSYFMCPILQEVMRDPHIAADGFTYEAEAIKGWLESGHDTSPMTNVALPHKELIPNRALRSAIQEWLQQQHLQ